MGHGHGPTEQRQQMLMPYQLKNDGCSRCGQAFGARTAGPQRAGDHTALSLRHADEIFNEAENRLHVQKAVLVTLMGSRGQEQRRF